MRQKPVIVLLAGGLLALVLPQAGHAKDLPLHRIKAAEIRKTFAGREFSDEIHWVETYKADGTLYGSGMGRAFTRHWTVKNDMLCLSDAKGEDCREVWTSGTTVELRRDAADDLGKRGIIRAPGR
jgi:transposase-like protein